MKRKMLVNIAFLLYFVSLSVAYGAYKIYSSTISVTVGEYVLSMEVDNQNPAKYQIINFTGYLIFDGSGVPSETIVLYESSDGKVWKSVASNNTNKDGFYSIGYNVTERGTFEFKAGFEVP